ASVGLLLNSSTVALAAVVGVIFLMRWRSGGQPADLHIGVAVVVFGGLKVGIGDVLPGVAQPTAVRSPLATILASAALFLVIALLVRGTGTTSWGRAKSSQQWHQVASG